MSPLASPASRGTHGHSSSFTARTTASPEPAEKALVTDLAPIAVRGRAYGFYNFIVGVSAVPAGVLTGWLWQTWSPLVALATGAGIAAAASVALVVWSSSSNHDRMANE